MKPYQALILCSILFFQACTDSKPTEEYTASATARLPSTTEPFTYIRYADTLSWRTVESQVTSQTKEQVAAALAPFFAEDISEYNPHMPLPKYVHLIDLNGNGQLDAVYNGPHSGEGNLIRIWLKKDGRYQSIFKQFGEVKQLELSDNQLTHLTVLDFGCCAEYVEVETTYAFNSQFTFNPVLQRGTVSFTQRPRPPILSTPKPFQLTFDSVALRALPVVDDTSTLIYDVVGKGNSLLKFGKGAKGIRWASLTDSLKQQWHYVEMMPAQKPKGYLMYSKNDIPTRTFGWMLAADIR